MYQLCAMGESLNILNPLKTLVNVQTVGKGIFKIQVLPFVQRVDFVLAIEWEVIPWFTKSVLILLQANGS